MAYHLSLDETARQTDKVLEVGGVSFLAEERLLHFLDGLVIDVQSFYGREAVVAYHGENGGGCC